MQLINEKYNAYQLYNSLTHQCFWVSSPHMCTFQFFYKHTKSTMYHPTFHYHYTTMQEPR